MKQERIDRINELARKSRTPEGLTELEKAEQTELRNEFRATIKANLTAQLDNIEIVDELPEKDNAPEKAKEDVKNDK